MLSIKMYKKNFLCINYIIMQQKVKTNVFIIKRKRAKKT